jgi:hypothetical protein
MTDYENWQVITRQELASLYEKLTMAAIAARYGVTTGAVAHRLRTWGLSARITGKKHSPGPKRQFNPPRDELESLYQKLSMREIAKHYGVGETVIFTRIKEAGLRGPTRSERLSGTPKSESHKAAIKAAVGDRSGPANPNWRGGVSPISARERTSAKYRAWKEAVLQRADYRCERCGVEAGSRCDCCGHIRRLHAHHKEHFSRNHAERYNPANGEALCERCHHVEHFEQIG